MRADPAGMSLPSAARLPRALRREGFLARTSPLAIAALIGLTLLLGSEPSPRPGLIAIADGGVIAIWAIAFAVPWQRLPRWMDLVPPLLLFALLSGIRQGVDPHVAPTTLAPLFLVPAFWVALFGSRRDVLLMLVVMAAARLVPPVISGDDTELLRGTATILVSATVCVLAHGVVDRSREAEQALRAILHAVRDGVAIIAHDRSGIYANPAYLELFELDPARFVGMTPEAFTAHAGRLTDDPDGFARRFAGLEAATDDDASTFTFARPVRRIVRRTISPIDLPSGPGYLVVWHDVTADHDLASQRDHQALTDALTGLANRRAGELALGREEARVRRAPAPLSIALFDLDHFKRINDEHGHDAGDRVLAAVAEVLRAQARATDTIARWGGEEFLAVLPGDAGGARAYYERVRAALAGLTIGPVGSITVSAGVAVLGDREDVQQALKRADDRLYDAKRAGRDRLEGVTT